VKADLEISGREVPTPDEIWQLNNDIFEYNDLAFVRCRAVASGW